MPSLRLPSLASGALASLGVAVAISACSAKPQAGATTATGAGATTTTSGAGAGGAHGTGGHAATGGSTPDGGPSCPALGGTTALLPAARIAAWSPGIPGGIPTYPQDKTACASGCAFTTAGDDATDDSGTIQSCLAATATGHACVLGPGTYAIAHAINVPTGVVLRGAGQGKTILHNRNGGGTTVMIGGNASFGQPVAITSGVDQGSTSLVVAQASGFTVGQYIAVTESIDSSFVDVTGYDGKCTWCGGPWQNGAGTQVMGQLVQVTAVSGSTITIDRPLYIAFQASLSPVVLQMSGVTTAAGVESLSIQEMQTGAGENNGLVELSGCAGCWAKDVEVSAAYAEFVELQFSKGCEVRDSYIHDPQTAASGRGYGAHILFWNSDHLIENDVFVKNRHSVAFEGGGSGCVVGYNYAYRDWESDSDPTWLGDDIIFHGAHPYMNLLEGNIHQQLMPDDTWGSSSHNTAFRNHITASSDSPAVATEALHAIDIDQKNPYFNVVGNVLGVAGTTIPAVPSLDCSAPGMWRLGCTSNGSGEAAAIDPSVVATLVHCGNGSFATTAGAGTVSGFASAPLPAVEAACSVPLPASYYHACKPAFFGSCPWPPIGPDVAGFVSDIPAKRKLEQGSYTAGCP
jgi:hypothetical protein